MGYMGLSHWAESDNAADWRHTLQNCFENFTGKKLKAEVRRLVMKEVKDMDNRYNTDGPVSIALVMEDEDKIFGDDDKTLKFSKLLSKKEFVTILKGLDNQIKECKGNDPNSRWHLKNFKRMRNCVYRKSYKE
jgi:hypothetical protein